MKSDPQSQAFDFDLWNALNAKYEKYSTLTYSCRHDAFRKRDHDDHPDEDVLLEGENRVKRKKTSTWSKFAKASTSNQPARESNTTSSEQPQQQEYDALAAIPEIDEDEVISKDATLELLDELKSFNNDVKQYGYHLEQAKNYMENQIVWSNKQEDLMIPKKDTLVFYGPQRNSNETLSYQSPWDD
ncbi:hypothetical protein Tco_1131229 [Tanacetum coccineum]